MLKIDEHDLSLVSVARAAIEAAILNAHSPIAVTKKLAVLIMHKRNQGRKAAIRRHPFGGKCEASGAPLERQHANLDELDPELGYTGRVRWLCPVANNSGRHSCGVCKGPADSE